ncbi:MAG TPA: uroporphyrinogen-III C-methyltransferase, partial [Woeseiaceae bacterium]|nr:uroporphyrinogen-III C-methyltransferase [Woeseiaceae bacterium]
IALELADERIAQIASPGLTDVRRALRDELRELEALDIPDIEGAALTLSSLADTVGSLPLKNDVLPPAQRDVEVDEQLSGMQRALQSLKNAMSDVVSVRRTEQPLKPLLPPDAAYFLRSNLTLQLQAARLALLRGEQALFEQSLDDAAKWIDEYFDTARTPVASALDTIAELRASQTSPPRVDISRSLKLLRRFMALEAQERKAGTGQPQ